LSCNWQLWNELAEELKKPYYMEAERIKNQHRQDFPGKYLLKPVHALFHKSC